MERCFVTALAALAIVTPAIVAVGGGLLRPNGGREIPFLENAREIGLNQDPIRLARVEMYLSNARAIIDDPHQQTRACALLKQASRAASSEAKRLYRRHCAD